MRTAHARTFISATTSLLLFATAQPLVVAAEPAPGTIAYVRGADRREIRVVSPDGSNDRPIWSEPRADAAIDSLAWSPDGSQLAFSSDHEQACSTFETDVFVLQPAGIRRVTNPPACDALAHLSKGTVTVHVENRTASSDNFFVYVAGAPVVQPLPLGPFGSGVLTFDNVAALGDNQLQEIVVTNGAYRWTDPSTAVQVRPAEAVDAGTFVVSEQGGLKRHGAGSILWRGDGLHITFGMGDCGPKYEIASDAGAGAGITPVLSVDALACWFDRGQTPRLANKVLYYDLATSAVYLTEAGSRTPGEVVLAGPEAESIHGLQLLPDGSGFLFSKDALNDDIEWSGNIYEYSFASRKTAQVTSLRNEFANLFSVSPDGQWVVFERGKEQFREGPLELWIMRRDGTQLRRLVSDAQLPSWGP